MDQAFVMNRTSNELQAGDASLVRLAGRADLGLFAAVSSGVIPMHLER